MQPAASLPQAKGREGTEEQWQKDREGAPRGDDRDEKTPHTTGRKRAGAPEHQRLLWARNEHSKRCG